VNVIVAVPRKPDDGTRGLVTLGVSADQLADGLARSAEWAIRLRPELLSKGDSTERRTVKAAGKAVSGAAAITFRGVTWVPLSVFHRAGAAVTWNRTSGRGSVTLDGKSLDLRLFRSPARLGAVGDPSADSTDVDLGAAVQFSPDGPVVSVLDVAKALGMWVTLSPRTLRFD
jgi:hypothetical protein